MGSNQSSTTTTAPSVETPTPIVAKVDNSTTTSETKESNTPKRTGIDLVNHKCRKKKASYDKCVSKWYNERFLTGKSINQEEECGELFDIYKQCYLKHLKREFFDKGGKKVKEGSLLAEELDEQ
jgi:carboxypeptidase C (cathepsin A)